MFLLRELPNAKELNKFKLDYEEMDYEKTITALKLMKSASLLINKLEEHFRKLDLSQSKFLALMVIQRSSESQLSNTEIAYNLGISKKNTSRLLSNMEGLGLVTKKDHKTNSKIKLYFLTKKGLKTLNNVLPDYYKQINEFLKNFEHKDLSSFESLLDLTLD